MGAMVAAAVQSIWISAIHYLELVMWDSYMLLPNPPVSSLNKTCLKTFSSPVTWSRINPWSGWWSMFLHALLA